MNLRNNRLFLQLVFRWRNYLDKHSYNFGKNNRVLLKGVNVGNRIHVRGSNNEITADNGSVVKNSLLHILGSNNKIIIGEKAFVSGAELWVEDNNCLIEIGTNTFVGHHSHIACTEDGSEIIIGSNGMVSSYCQIRTGDSHSITDLNGKRINPASSVHIGNHCWLGEGCKILKGVTIGCDSVISTGAIVTKSFGTNVLLGGLPARVLKESINWNEKRL